jgi:hypothetical protein
MKEEIYLIGQISVDREETYLWRKDVRTIFTNDDQFEIIDPCDNEWNKSNSNFEGTDPLRLKIYKKFGSGLIVPKDYSYVLRSTGCLANLNHYDTKKPFIGTLFELSWYYQAQEKCVIGIYDGDPCDNVYCDHPFIRETIDVWCKDHIEAAHLLKNYYKRGVR